MKIVRSGPEAPKDSPPQRSELVLTIDPKAISSVIEALAMRVAEPKAPVIQHAPEKPAEKPAEKPPQKAEARPSAFTVSITKRDSRGRVLEFDVRAKEEAEPEELTPFEHGFSSVQTK